MSGRVFDQVVEKLVSKQIISPRLEARLLMAHVLNVEPDEISPSTVLDEVQKLELNRLLEKRLAHMPIDKIIGRRAFYKYDFFVNEDVLSPRPDTEVLVEAAVLFAQESQAKTILDLGTGSGCILCSLLKECETASGWAVDQSAKSLAVARKNAEHLGIGTRVTWLQADWFDPDFPAKFPFKFDLIVSNPPYIASAEIETLDAEVKLYDPYKALDGGADGYQSYRRIAELAPQLLNDDGRIFIEAGINQADRICQIFEENGLMCCDVLKDLSGVERCVIFQKK